MHFSSTTHDQPSLALGYDGIGSIVSLAYFEHFIGAGMTSFKSETYRLKIIGPSIDPWGIPKAIVWQD